MCGSSALLLPGKSLGSQARTSSRARVQATNRHHRLPTYDLAGRFGAEATGELVSRLGPPGWRATLMGRVRPGSGAALEQQAGRLYAKIESFE
jgi:hypothetical protein